MSTPLVNIYTCWRLAYNTNVVHSKLKAPQNRTLFVGTLAIVVVLFTVLIISRTGSEAFQTVSQNSDTALLQKARILDIVSSKGPLTPEERDTLFLSLSGAKMLLYRFTDAEKNMIVKAINAANTQTRPVKGSSSAKGSFSGVPISKLSLVSI